MKFLITGGAGFIGSAVIRHIINHTSDSVVNVDKLTYAGNLESLAEVSNHSRYVFEQVDICDRTALDNVFAQHQPDAVMHLAAESHVDRSIDGPVEFIQTNIVGTYTLLEATRAYWQTLADNKKQHFRFHHISTDEVYGDLPHPNDANANKPSSHANKLSSYESKPSSCASKPSSCAKSQDLPLFTEQTAYAPSSPYSASKASSDHLVRAWHRTYGLPIVVTNCSNNYGPYQFPEKLIPLVILNALEQKPLPIYGKGDQIRDWLYVEDHACALYLVVTQGKIGETYNIGGHNERQNIEVVRTICQVLDELAPLDRGLRRGAFQAPASNKTPPIASYADLITHVTDRPGHDRRYAIDANKIKKELGWIPQDTFETGMRKTVQWYLNNANWCQRVQDGSYQRQRLGLK